MAKRKSANPFQGRWLIEPMDQWDVAEESEELQPCPVLRDCPGNYDGHLQVGAGQRKGLDVLRVTDSLYVRRED